MKKRSFIHIFTIVVLALGFAPPISAQTVRYSMFKTEILLNGSTFSTPDAFVTNSTTYMPIFYVQQLLYKLGIQNTWDGSKTTQTWILDTHDSASLSSLNIQERTGTINVVVNGQTVERNVDRIVTTDMASGYNTTFVPIWYIQQLLNALGVENQWNGIPGIETWTMTSTTLPGSVNGLDEAQKQRADQLISLFENGTIDIQYGYAEQLHDGRGITCGRAGFTTGTGDAYEVVQHYTDRVPNNILAKYLPELNRLLTAQNKDDVSGLTGFSEAWSSLANDPIFRSVQNQVSDELYYNPSVVHSNDLGLVLPLSRAEIYDAIIQHGDGDDPDGLQALINQTNKIMGGSPEQGIDEKKWLNEFLDVRESDLLHPADGSTQAAWSQSTGRIVVFRDIAQSGNYQLNGPIRIQTDDYDTTIQ